MPQVRAASVRDAPSRTRASANIRRAASASRDRDASRRKSAASCSSRVIDTATMIRLAILGEPNHSRRVRRKLTYESDIEAAGMTPAQVPPRNSDLEPTHVPAAAGKESLAVM